MPPKKPGKPTKRAPPAEADEAIMQPEKISAATAEAGSSKTSPATKATSKLHTKKLTVNTARPKKVSFAEEIVEQSPDTSDSSDSPGFLERKGGWVYAIEPTKEEKSVIKKGFPWVSISHIKAAEPLGYHSHHSLNTHLVLTGRIAFFKKNPGPTPPISPTHPPPRRSLRLNPPPAGSDQAISGLCDKYSGLITVEEGVVYRAGLETEGCRFVEGHSVLSPTTRDRFILRGKIRWNEGVGSQETGKVMREVREEGDVSEMVREKERLRLVRKEEKRVRVAEEAEREGLHGMEEGKHGVSAESGEEDGGAEAKLSAKPRNVPEDLSDSHSEEWYGVSGIDSDDSDGPIPEDLSDSEGDEEESES